MEVSGDVNDLRQQLFSAILAVIAQVFLLCSLSWNVVVIIVCIILDILLLLVGLVDWLYFKRKIILDAYCCFTHPSTSVFIRFSSSLDRLARTSAKFIYKGFVADKDELLEVLKEIITLDT